MVFIDSIYNFFIAFCPCILNIYGQLVRCNVSTDRFVADIVGCDVVCGRYDIHPRYQQQQFMIKNICETDEFRAEKSKGGLMK